jgi:hypothetical protein
MLDRKTHLSDPTVIRCIKNLLAIDATSLTIGSEIYILNPMQNDVQDAISHISNQTQYIDYPDNGDTPKAMQTSRSPIHNTDDDQIRDASLDTNKPDEILPKDDTTTPQADAETAAGSLSLNESNPTENIHVFQISIIKSQLDALSIAYGETFESDISDIPERGSPGSQQWHEYIDTCFRVWGIRSRFVKVADRLTTVLKIAHMSDLYVLYLEIEEDVKAHSYSTSRGRDSRSVVYDRFCNALPETHRKNSRVLKSEAEKCFVFLMTTGAQKIYDTGSISYESVRRLPASRVKTLLSAIRASGTIPAFGDYRTLVIIPRKAISTSRPLTDSVIPTDEDVVQRLLDDKKKHLRSRDVESRSDSRQSKRARFE